MPKGKEFRFVSHNDPLMSEAAVARIECAGDPLYPVGIVLVRDGVVLARAGNGFNKGGGTTHICPRVVLGCPSGQGYDLCTLHDSPGHAETMLMNIAREQGLDTVGCDVYMFGHWWCCEPCWKAMLDAGIRDVFVTNDAQTRFSRENVFAETLTSSITSVSFQDCEESLLETLRRSCEEIGCQTQDTGEVSVRRTPKGLDVWFEDRCVYQIESEDGDVMARMLQNVLRQL